MRPVTPEFLCDDYQDVRVLDAPRDYVELEVILYPFNTVGEAIGADGAWRSKAAAMTQWLAPGPTADWTPAMQRDLEAALAKDGIDAAKLSDKALVEQAAGWLCRRTQTSECFTAFVTAFDERGRPFLPPELAAAAPAVAGPDELRRQWARDLSARGITHRELRREVAGAIGALRNSWASHSLNEVFVDGRWRRLDCDRLGQDIRDRGMFGLMVHVATFSDWADARMPATIGKRQTLGITDDVFGHTNPYSTIALRDEFGPHCKLANPEPAPRSLRITTVHWGDAADVPDDVRRWFAARKVFGLVARIEGAADRGDLRSFMRDADLRATLVADGAATLGVALDAGNWWLRPEGHAFVVVPFGPADREGLRTGVPYRFVARNGEKSATWQVDEGLRVVRPR